MKQLRLKAIAKFIKKEDCVADIGCDHAYLAIYLKENNLCQFVLASDIHEKALENARQNILHKKLDIPTILSDGVQNIRQEKLNTLVISGMGTSTILHIVKEVNRNFIQKIIVQSNNDLSLLRKNMPKFGYYLEDELVVYEKGHYYVIGNYTRQKRKRKRSQIEFGLFKKENKAYYHFLQEQMQSILKKLESKNVLKKLKLYYKIFLLQKYL